MISIKRGKGKSPIYSYFCHQNLCSWWIYNCHVAGGYTSLKLQEKSWKAMLALTISVDSSMNSGDGDTQHILRNWDCCLAWICWDVIPCRLTRCGIASILSSGKHTKNYGKSPCYHWMNPLFRLGHGFNSHHKSAINPMKSPFSYG